MSKKFFSDISLPLDAKQLENLDELIQDMSFLQISWISGYLWGRVNSNQLNSINNIDSNTNIIKSNNVITIIYASQSGNARKIAEQLYKDLLSAQFKVVIFNIIDYAFKKIAQEMFLLIITSTYGNGEPPDSAVVFYKFLFSKKSPMLKTTYFAIFSLGDSSYENFAKAGKDLDQRLEELGAQRLCDRIDADVDYQQSSCIWRLKIIDILRQKINERDMSYSRSILTSNKVLKVDDHFNFSEKNPFIANLSLRQKITSRHSMKDIYHLEIDLTGSKLTYQPGDALGVWYENDVLLINKILSLLNLTGKELIPYKGKSLSIDLILRKYCDLTKNTFAFIKDYASLQKEGELFSLIPNKEKIDKMIASMSIVDVFRLFPIKLSAMQLFQLLRPLKPRFYSIASSQKEVGEEVHITVSVVRYIVNNYLRTGAASGYLVDRLQESDKLKIFIQVNENFRLPKDLNTPIIMISAGTGIAPFRAFMQERLACSASGKNWLFFGNPRFVDDFLYQIEWQNYFKQGLLTKINTAWSRDQDNKIYVQHKLLEYGDEIWYWLNDGAHVYVCGNAQRMATGVQQSLLKIIMKYGIMDVDKANEFLDEMFSQKRYHRDVY